MLTIKCKIHTVQLDESHRRTSAQKQGWGEILRLKTSGVVTGSSSLLKSISMSLNIDFVKLKPSFFFNLVIWFIKI